MEYRKFEQHISDTLGKDETSIDIQSLIDAIHTKKGKDRKGIIALFISLGLFLFFTYILYTFSGVMKPNNNDSYQFSAIAQHQTKQNKNNIYEVQSLNRFKTNHTQSTNQLNPDQNTITLENRNFGNKVENFTYTNRPQKAEMMPAIAQIDVAKNIDMMGPKLSDDEISTQRETEIVNRLTDSNFAQLKSKEQQKFSIFTNKVVCPTFSNSSKLFIQLIPEVGYFMPFKKLENLSNESNNVFALRDKNEKTLEGLQAALHVQLRREKSPFYIRAGVSFSRLTEQMKLNYSYTRKDTVQGIISITVSQTGDTITTIYGDIIQERRLSGQKIGHHSFSLLDIPVSLGFEKNMKQWVFGLEGGIMFNVSSKTKGNILVSDTSFALINTQPENFRTSLGLSYFGGIFIGRDFDRLGRFYLNARVRYIPTSFSGDQNRIRQSYLLAGINLGYVFTF